MICQHPTCDDEATSTVVIGGRGKFRLCESHAEEVFPIRGEDPSFGLAAHQSVRTPDWLSEAA